MDYDTFINLPIGTALLEPDRSPTMEGRVWVKQYETRWICTYINDPHHSGFSWGNDSVFREVIDQLKLIPTTLTEEQTELLKQKKIKCCNIKSSSICKICNKNGYGY